MAAEFGPLCNLGFRDHAAADARGRGGGSLPEIHEAISDADRAGAGARTKRAGAVERPGLLPAGAHAAQGGAVCGVAPGREFAACGPRSCAELPGIGCVYGRGGGEHLRMASPVAVVDGNVERVLCRVAGWEAGSRKGRAADAGGPGGIQRLSGRICRGSGAFKGGEGTISSPARNRDSIVANADATS